MKNRDEMFKHQEIVTIADKNNEGNSELFSNHFY
jgi:hypothetical protein